MRNIKDVPFDDVDMISKDSKVVHASSFGVGGADDEIRIIVFDKKLISDGSEFKLVN